MRRLARNAANLDEDLDGVIAYWIKLDFMDEISPSRRTRAIARQRRDNMRTLHADIEGQAMGIVQSQGVPGGWCRRVDLREFEPGAADRQAFEVGLRPLVGRTSPRDIHALTRDLVRLLKRPRESEAA